MSLSVRSDTLLMAQLWTRFKAGDEQAFTQLARIHYWVLFNHATRFTKNRELIKDCIQELMLELWYRRTKVVDAPCVTSYFIKAFRNNLFRSLKKETSRETTVDEWERAGSLLTDGRNGESDLIVAELFSEKQELLHQGINQLPTRQKEVIQLKFYEGMSNETIAKVMEIERQTVANFLYRALTTLKSTVQTPIPA